MGTTIYDHAHWGYGYQTNATNCHSAGLGCFNSWICMKSTKANRLPSFDGWVQLLLFHQLPQEPHAKDRSGQVLDEPFLHEALSARNGSPLHVCRSYISSKKKNCLQRTIISWSYRQYNPKYSLCRRGTKGRIKEEGCGIAINICWSPVLWLIIQQISC